MNKYLSRFKEAPEEKKPYTKWKDNPQAGKPLVTATGKPIINPKTGEQKIGTGKIRDYAEEEADLDAGKWDNVLDITKHLVITQGSDKMKGINSLNVDPRMVPSCRKFHSNPKMVCSKCYSFGSIEGLKPNLGVSFKVNARLLTKEVYEVGSFPKKNVTPLFRICSHGDIIDEVHMKNCLNFIKQHMESGLMKHCAWWSKEPEYFAMIRSYSKEIGIPQNKLTLIFSTYLLDEPNPMSKAKGAYDRVFSVYSYKYLKENKINPAEVINCGGERCLTCKGARCYTSGGAKDVRELLKQDRISYEKDLDRGEWK